MTSRRATAWAPVNLALVKHWGYGDAERLSPARASLSLTLAHGATTTVEWVEGLRQDEIVVGGRRLGPGDGEKAAAAHGLLRDIARAAGLAGRWARVASESTVPTSGGMASSAAGAAALCLAALGAAGLADDLDERGLVAWCRKAGSISALRSLRGGVVVLAGRDGECTLDTVEPALELAVISCLVEDRPKAVSSSAGHLLAPSSPFFPAFVDRAPALVAEMSAALAAGRLDRVGELAEQDALAMHGVMLSCRSPVIYATDATWAVWRQVASWRGEGAVTAYCTLDAGPNPHVLCRAADAEPLASRLAALPEVKALWRSLVSARGARLIETSSA